MIENQEATAPGAKESPEVNLIGELVTGARHLLVPLARMYLGSDASPVRSEYSADGSVKDAKGEDRLLQLALHKLIIEAGSLPAPGTTYQPHSTTFAVDPKTGQGIAFELSHVLLGFRAFSAWASAPPAGAVVAAPIGTDAQPRSAVTAARADASATDTLSTRDLRYSRSSSSSSSTSAPTARSGAATGCGCGQKGGGSPRPAANRPPTSSTSGSRCECERCEPAPPQACKPWVPSCEMRNRLRDCLKEIVCDLLLCLEGVLCAPPGLSRDPRQELAQCLRDVFCKIFRCVREAICPAPVPCPKPLPPISNCLPCGYAVEDPR